MKKKVSWLVPVYNSSEEKITRALDSMLEQTLDNFEVILVVEYGTDALTKGICEKYAENDERIHIIENEERLGIAESLNRGLDACQGEFIARMDTDDYSYPDRLEKQVAFLEKNKNVGILGGNARVVNARTGMSYIRYPKKMSAATVAASLLFGTCFMHPTIMIRNNISDLKYPNTFVEDYALFAKMINKVGMEIDDYIVLDYYDDPDSISKTNFQRVRKESGEISRRAIETNLGIDTSSCDDSIFGWRTRDVVARDPYDYLKECLAFYHKMIETNREKCRFDERALLSSVYEEWKKTINLCEPYVFPELIRSVHTIQEKDIDELRERAEKYCADEKQIILFGAGNILEKWLKQAGRKQVKNVLCICDSDKNKQGMTISGKTVISPDNLQNAEYDYIAISSVLHEDSIRECLAAKGICDEKVQKLPIPEVTAFGQQLYAEQILAYKNSTGKKRAFLFCSPDYGNIGDHAIAEAIHNYMEEISQIALLDVPLVYQEYLMPLLKKIIKPEDIIYITGGGFLGTLWYDAEKSAQNIIKAFPHNQVVIFPQTLYWRNDDTERLNEAQILYCSNKERLTLFARDEISKHYMNKYYSGCRVLKAPDMTLSVDWSNYYKSSERKGCLLCLKDDQESILDANDKNKVRKMLISKYGEVNEDSNTIMQRMFTTERRALIEKQLNKWASTQLVVTDRLHGAIFAVITGTPCIMLNNCNQKLKTAFQILKRAGNIFFANDLSELEEYIVHSSEFCSMVYDKEKWKDDFNEIRQTIIFNETE